MADDATRRAERSDDAPTADGDLLALLRSSSLFGDLPEEALGVVAAHLDVERFRPGEMIIRAGEPGDRCYLIRLGQAGVVSRDLIWQEVVLTTFGPGEVFGEIALIRESPRTATVRALTDLETYVLSRADFDRLMGGYASFAAHMRRHADLLEADSFLKKASPFAGLPGPTINRLVGQLHLQRARAGDIIIRQGDEGDQLYLVRSGRVEVLKDGRRVAGLEVGDCFGEVALLAAERRTATVRALEDTTLLTLTRADFEAVLQEHQPLRRKFHEVVRIRYRAAAG